MQSFYDHTPYVNSWCGAKEFVPSIFHLSLSSSRILQFVSHRSRFWPSILPRDSYHLPHLNYSSAWLFLHNTT